MKKHLMIIIGVVILVSLCAAGYNSKIYKEPGGNREVVVSGGEIALEGGKITIGSSTSSSLNFVQAGTIKINNGKTSATLSVAGATSTSIVYLSPGTTLGSATKYFATPGTGTIKATVDQNPATTVTLNYLVVGKE